MKNTRIKNQPCRPNQKGRHPKITHLTPPPKHFTQYSATSRTTMSLRDNLILKMGLCPKPHVSHVARLLPKSVAASLQAYLCLQVIKVLLVRCVSSFAASLRYVRSLRHSTAALHLDNPSAQAEYSLPLFRSCFSMSGADQTECGQHSLHFVAKQYKQLFVGG